MMKHKGCRHLLVTLTPHGFGHAAMTAPAVNALRRLLPDLRLTLQTTTPVSLLRTCYDPPFDVVADTCDFGLAMRSATEIDVEESAARYRALHADLERFVDIEARRLDALGVDLMLANIPYVSLLAARKTGLPAVALSCLNWADIYHAVMGDRAEAPAIESKMLEGYASSRLFLRPVPSPPMERLSNVRTIGPLARQGAFMPERLRRLVGGEKGDKIGLIAFGGMDPGFGFSRWPHLSGWKWVVAAQENFGHPDMVPLAALDMDFVDILRSADVVVGKPGYGTFAEAGVNGTPMLTLPRPGWLETPYLLAWLSAVGRCSVARMEEMFDPKALENQLQRLLSIPAKELVDPSGGLDAASVLLSMLDGAREMPS